jgi:2-haloacid dehalogenase
MKALLFDVFGTCVDFRSSIMRGPDTVRGLKRLKKRYIIATLSNGNVALLVNMAKHAGLPWDCIFSAETFRHYKPDPETYLGAADQLGLRPGDVMLVAAHTSTTCAAPPPAG